MEKNENPQIRTPQELQASLMYPPPPPVLPGPETLVRLQGQQVFNNLKSCLFAFLTGRYSLFRKYASNY